eukprot:TRINITY_DN8901_c0_g1_i4.p1 TRINITY_DN8901_c0_g1~~TRINITY_DN8901_c0_g1_i4.p1  ORF type:complete len:488 (-),score=-8.00 TRINITY_DN8901_c0_g1_i4:24-1487(-)
MNEILIQQNNQKIVFNAKRKVIKRFENKIIQTNNLIMSKNMATTKFPKFSQGLANDPTTRRIWFGIATAHDFESHDGMTEENLYQKIFASHFGQLAIIFLWTSGTLFHVAWQGNFEQWVKSPLTIRPIAHAIWDPHFGHVGPFFLLREQSQWAICWKLTMKHETFTVFVFILAISRQQKLFISKQEPQRLHAHQPQETFFILLNFTMTQQNSIQTDLNLSWIQWFSGLVDADGCLLLSPKGYTSLEITMGINDIEALQYIQQHLGGYIKPRSNARAFRYRLHKTQSMITVVNLLNGHCVNSVRIKQLQKLCQHFNITYIEPHPIELNNAWFAGFFDGDGTISYSFKKGYPQLTVSVSNKKACDCIMFQKIFNGTVRLDSSCNIHKWEISKNDQIVFFYNYLKKYPLQSYKKKRFFLLPLFFKLRKRKAYNAPKSTLLYKTWVKFEKKWTQIFKISEILLRKKKIKSLLIKVKNIVQQFLIKNCATCR